MTVKTQAAEVWMDDVQMRPFPTYDGKTREESERYLQTTIRDVFTKKLAALGHKLVGGGVPNRITIEVKSWKQRNRSTTDILNSPSKAASETSVEIRLTLTTAAGAQTFEKLSASLPGQFFGSTNARELEGSPADKAFMIQHVAKQKATALANVLWKSVETSIRNLSLS